MRYINNFKYKDYKKLDVERCLDHLRSIDFSYLYQSSNVDLFAENLTLNIYNTFDNFVPFSQFQNKSDDWFNDLEIKIYKEREGLCVSSLF